LPAAVAAAAVVLALNAWPHFVTTVGPNTADMPEPELGWPWIFFNYGQMYAGYGPWWDVKRLAYDVICAASIVALVGHATSRITECCRRRATAKTTHDRDARLRASRLSEQRGYSDIHN